MVPDGEVSARSLLRKLELELAEARQRYTESHPDIQLLRRSVASLTALAAVEGSVPARMDAAPRRSPQRETLIYQLDSRPPSLPNWNCCTPSSADKQRLYDARLLQAPEIEREYRDLARDYGSAQERYAEIWAKQMQAEIAEELGSTRKPSDLQSSSRRVST